MRYRLHFPNPRSLARRYHLHPPIMPTRPRANPPLRGIPNIPVSTVDSQLDRSTANATRRSARAPVPSTRAEKLNEIGQNVVTVPVAVSTTEDTGPPDWFDPACKFLRADGRLGQEWDQLVDMWIEFEKAMGYGAPGKGSLPVAKRPEEWKDWAAKTKKGVRPYDRIPFILEPAEFGIVLTGWWHSLQPPFRVSDNIFPNPVYSETAVQGDVWAPIRKAGPNGLVSVVTMMRWWGIEAMFPSNEYKTDSRSEWRYMVYDVRMCVEQMFKTTPTSSLKRKRDHGDVASKENKRQA
ncbi:hypothetical protein NMY22_g10666 [Coprinellus aureogranulatus]|nr:hypothetical protein NMY22_g10666 [Coprinellus aureogranulatus]